MPPSIAFSSLAGCGGALKVGHVEAITLGEWTLVPGDAPGSWGFTARAESVDQYLVTQGPDTLVLVFVAKQNAARWRWKGVALEISGDRVRGTLVGPPEDV
jgi:hypothetical protein